jgi:hypothetical protein
LQKSKAKQQRVLQKCDDALLLPPPKKNTSNPIFLLYIMRQSYTNIIVNRQTRGFTMKTKTKVTLTEKTITKQQAKKLAVFIVHF